MQIEFMWDSRANSDQWLYNVKVANGLCLSCNRPLGVKHYLCIYCHRQLKTNGLEHRRVTFTRVGEITINYQQMLHRKFFNCSAVYKYRGNKEDRIRCDRITNDAIDRATTKLNKYLLKHHSYYHKVMTLRNFPKRLIFNQLLYLIAYFHLDSKEFKSLPHYQATIVFKLNNDIRRAYVRTLGKDNNIKPNNPNRPMHEMITEYNAIIDCVEELGSLIG